ncbi:MAG: hypothetical protein D6725_05140, partial [Planctomycetota bacterium]
ARIAFRTMVSAFACRRRGLRICPESPGSGCDHCASVATGACLWTPTAEQRIVTLAKAQQPASERRTVERRLQPTANEFPNQPTIRRPDSARRWAP